MDRLFASDAAAAKEEATAKEALGWLRGGGAWLPPEIRCVALSSRPGMRAESPGWRPIRARHHARLDRDCREKLGRGGEAGHTSVRGSRCAALRGNGSTGGRLLQRGCSAGGRKNKGIIHPSVAETTLGEGSVRSATL